LFGITFLALNHGLHFGLLAQGRYDIDFVTTLVNNELARQCTSPVSLTMLA
jgi:hypothetical protein